MNKNYTVSTSKLPKYLTKTEVDIILDKAKNDNRRNHLILLTLFRTGLRNSELVNLKKQDIKDQQITVYDGKGKKDRAIPLDNELDHLLGLYSDNLKPTDNLFPLSTRAIRNIVKKYSDKKEVHPHTFRHSFAVYCLKAGVNVRALQKVLGHASLSNTQVYLDIVNEDVKTEFKKVVF